MTNKKHKTRYSWPKIFGALVLVLAIVGTLFYLQIRHTTDEGGNTTASDEATAQAEAQVSAEEQKAAQIQALSTEAETLAASFDYDTAIAKLDEALALDPTNNDLITKKAEYDTAKNALVPYSGEVSQVFFHELIVDTSRVFGPKNGDPGGHNSVMTTLKEFNSMISQMYEKGYILITFDDLYTVKTKKNGKKVYKSKQLMLPKGKTPFIMSQDDVNCYQKTRIAIGGYSSKYVLDEAGKVKTLYVEEDETEKVGDYDLLPALETFCEEHPDFSYKGARAYIGLTGFDGALGYRVNHDHKNEANYDAECQALKQVADVAKAEGFRFACHSYAHGNQESESVDFLKQDTEKWLKEIGTWVGEADYYILPKGNWWFKKTGWTLTGTETMARLNTMASYGFNYIGGVGCDNYRVTYDNFVFMDRYNLDGYSMHNSKEKLSKFFDVDSVWDSGRPGFKGLN